MRPRNLKTFYSTTNKVFYIDRLEYRSVPGEYRSVPGEYGYDTFLIVIRNSVLKRLKKCGILQGETMFLLPSGKTIKTIKITVHGEVKLLEPGSTMYLAYFKPDIIEIVDFLYPMFYKQSEAVRKSLKNSYNLALDV